jgi:hypothetical protein
LDIKSNRFKYSKSFFRRSGTQTAGLAFGGEIPGSPNITTATEEYDGSTWTTSSYWFKYSKKNIYRLWNTNSSFSFWW